MTNAYADAKCRLDFELSPQGGVKCTADGFLTVPAAQHWIQVLDGALATHPKLFLANDWWLMKSYDGESRARLVEYFTANRKRIPTHFMLTNSAMILLGTNTAAIALGAAGITVRATRDRAVFEEWVRTEAAARAA